MKPGYGPETVNLDGWPATNNAWKILFSSVVIICCFLHVYIKIRDRSKKKYKDKFKNFKIYCAVGEVYQESGSMLEADAVKQSILLTYRETSTSTDNGATAACSRTSFKACPSMWNRSLKYVNLDRNEKSTEVKKALHLLEMARVYAPIYHTAANGYPYGRNAIRRCRSRCFWMSAC